MLGDGCFQTGADGVQAGSFVWVDEDTQTIVNKGAGSPTGFVGRELTGVPAQYLEEASLTIPAGFMVTVYEKGEFLVLLPEGNGKVEAGDVVVASPVSGMVIVDQENVETVETKYKYAANAQAGELVAISAWI